MSRTFGAIIIGDEILSGKRQDKHFAKIAEMLGARGLRLSWVEYLGDDRQRLAATFKRTMAAGDVVFSCGGMGDTRMTTPGRQPPWRSASGWNCTPKPSRS